ncbi:MAG: glycosyltransferase family 2 protein [Sandaracinaceae bacterium]
MSADLSVLVFAFDEEDNVEPVLAELAAWLDANEPGAEIVFVDDGSRDATYERAAAALSGRPHQLAKHPTNRGMGAAIKTGVALATRGWVTFLPADGQIAPDAIGTLRRAAAPGDVELVLSVYDHRDDGLDRTILSFGVRSLIFLVHGVVMRSDGPYLFRRTLMDPEQLPPDTFFLNFEVPIRALAAGIRTRTVTIACRPRLSGSSKVTALRRIGGVAKDLIDLRRRRLSRALSMWRR